MNFLAIANAEAELKNSQVVVLPVPYEATTSYAKGTALGPKAILAASSQVEFYDEETKLEPYLLGIHTAASLDFAGCSPSESMQVIENSVANFAKMGKLPLLLGGEHTITAPAVRGVAQAHSDITVVQFDAHADLRQDYEGTTLSHAAVMARVRENFPAVQIGVRALCQEEAAWIERDNLPVYFQHQLKPGWIEQALAAVNTDKIYLTIDVDVLDSSVMPETGTPEPGGMLYRDLLAALYKIMSHKTVVGIDIVEYMPRTDRHASALLAARLAAKCLAYWQFTKQA